MIVEEIYKKEEIKLSLREKWTDYSQLMKVRLTLTVVFSSAMGFLLGAEGVIDWLSFSILILGGFMVVGAANGINQIIERNYDKLMLRTANRPLASGRMSVLEAAIFTTLVGVGGVVLIAGYLNPLSGWLALASLVSYAFLYTPLKRVSPIAVFVGAFPGAIAPLLGWAAATGVLTQGAYALFAIQFFWQFPHFWAIAWVLDEDYRRAGYYLLPSYEGRGKKSALQMLWWTLVLVPTSFWPYWSGVSGLTSAMITLVASLIFFALSVKLYRSCENKDAKQLMFASFIYLPLVQLSFVIDKL